MTKYKPVLTEKSLNLAKTLNMYTFNVDRSLSKPKAREDISKMFSVKVLDVRSSSRIGKIKRNRTNSGGTYKSADSKTMIFELAAGDKIDYFLS